MKRQKHAARFAVAILLLAAIPVVLWFTFGRERDHAAEQVPGKQPERANADSRKSAANPAAEQPVSTQAGTNDEFPAGTSDPNTTRSEKAVLDRIDSLLALGLGRVTASQAQERIKEILDLPGSVSILKRKLTEGSLPEKLLSVYALIEGGGFSDELFQMVFNDPSPHVQAEALHFLLRNRQFDRVDAFVEERLLTLDWNTVTAFLDHAATAPNPDLPVALTRLNLGEGLALYLDLLAERSPSVRLAAFTRLDDPQATREAKSLLLRLVDSTPDEELVERLKPAFEGEANTAARIPIAQQIAARSSQQNQELVTFLSSGLGPTPAGLPPVELQFRENRIEKLRGHEQMMERLMSSDDFDPVALNGALAAYLREGDIVGCHALSRDTLNAVTAFLRARDYIYAPDIIARGEYIARRMK